MGYPDYAASSSQYSTNTVCCIPSVFVLHASCVRPAGKMGSLPRMHTLLAALCYTVLCTVITAESSFIIHDSIDCPCSMGRGSCEDGPNKGKPCTCKEGYEAIQDLQRCVHRSFKVANCDSTPFTGNCPGTCSQADTCKCKDGHIAEGQNCGEPSFENPICEGRNGTRGTNCECYGGRCYCDSDYLAVRGACLGPTIEPRNMKNCNVGVCLPPARCEVVDGETKCVCGAGYFSFRTQCLPSWFRQSSCDETTCPSPAACDETRTRCMCREMQLAVKYRCVPITSFLFASKACSACTDGTCVSYTDSDGKKLHYCICNPDFFAEGSTGQPGLKCFKDHFAAGESSQCPADKKECGIHGMCQGKDCVCNVGFVAMHNRCVKTSFTGATCEGANANCPESVGFCNASTGACKCKAGFFADGDSCVANSFMLNSTCKASNACGDQASCFMDTTCVCNLGFVVKDGKCVEGVEKVKTDDEKGDPAKTEKTADSVAHHITSQPWTIWGMAIAVILCL